MIRLFPRMVLALLSGILLAALGCADQPGSIEPTGQVTFSIVSGGGQSGLPHTELPDPLVVRARVGERGWIGQVVNFVVTEGGGSVFAGTALTDDEGLALDFWTLGFPGPQEVEVRAVDSKTGNKLVFATFEATAFGITTQSPLPDGVVGETYSETLTAAGGSGTVTWALKSGSPPLPLGLILGAAGVISGIPTASGTVVITVEATSAGLTSEKDLSITVHPGGGSTTTVTISSITISGTAGVVVDPSAVVGSIDVNLTIDEGTGTLIEAAVLFDGVVVGTQQFSTGARAEDGPAGAVRPVTIQINTAACAVGGTVTHLNGPKVVSATATTINAAGQKSTATATNSQTLTLVNPDVLLGALSSTGGTADGGAATFPGVGVGGGPGVMGVSFHIDAAGNAAPTPAAFVPHAATAGAAAITKPSLLNSDNQLWVGLTDLLGNMSFTSLAGAGSNALTTVGVEDNLPTSVAAAALRRRSSRRRSFLAPPPVALRTLRATA